MSLLFKKEQFIKELKNKLSQKSYGSTIEEIVLLRAFKYFDLKNTGFCTKDVFTRTMLKIGITSLTEEEISQLFSQFNPNKDGLLDYKEFVSNLYSNKSITSKKQPPTSTQPQPPNEKEIQNNLNKKEFLSQDPVEQILNQIREKLAYRGIEGVCSIARNFRIVDENNTQTIDFNEFKKCCKDFQFGLNDNQIQMAFVSFDRDNTGEIDYDEFLRTIRGEMNDFRKNLVNQAFNKLDINGNGEISFDEIQTKYNAKNHPEVLSGKKTEEQVLKEFMDTFQDTYNYLCGTETDNIITLEEFMEYYENVSMTIDNDEYFEIMLANGWNLNQNQNQYNKGWSNKEEEPEENKKNLAENYQERFGNRRPGQTEEEAKEENVMTALKKFKKEILSRGSGGLISLNRQFKLFDENNSKTLDYDEFSRALKEYKISLDDDEILKLFNQFDQNGNGIIEYEEFIKIVRGPLNEKRKAVVTQAFNKLDIDRSGFIDMNEIKHSYSAKNNPDVRQGKKTEEEVYTEFMETFQANHLLRSGPRSKRITYEEFLDYYNTISMGIKDDDQFVFLIQNAWKLNPHTYARPGQNRKDLNNINEEQDVNNYRNRDFHSSKVPFGVDEPKEKNQTPQVDKSLPVIEKLRKIISRRGTRGIMSIRREFMIADNDNSKTIDINEFKKFCHDYRIPLEENEIKLLFSELDINRNGKIDYEEFLKGMVGEMNERRKKIVLQVFKIFDKNQNGVIEMDDIRENYNAKLHPEVQSGKKTEEEVLAEFLDTFEYQFSLLNEGKTKDGKITMEEFLEYYNNISMSIKDDDYFEEMIKSVYNLDQRRTNKQGWRGEF
jgi:Ca2+-binding EF-hand superfamily protein